MPTGCAWNEVGIIAFADVRIDGKPINPLFVIRNDHGGVQVYFGTGMPGASIPRQLLNSETRERPVAVVLEAVFARDLAP